MIPTLHLGGLGRRRFEAFEAVDPHFASVVLLLHGDGANGSTTFTDSSSYGKTTTVSGGTVISTAQWKFGGASIDAVASGYIESTLDTEGSMTGDFTIEFWVRDITASQTLFYAAGGGYLYNSLFQGYGGPNLSLSMTGTAGQWYHVAITREGSTMRSFRDGVLLDTDTHAGTINMTTLKFGLYVPNGNLHFTGYYDDIRVTKGVARYTANFSVPTAPFPNA